MTVKTKRMTTLTSGVEAIKLANGVMITQNADAMTQRIVHVMAQIVEGVMMPIKETATTEIQEHAETPAFA